ncbi:hypothetical protein SAMN05428974_3768 [Sphingopyxis sp. YR583]|nr:hypothetical protein SAMN05428974_3768 [Sphingopyxis sp. YR583]
MCAEGPGARLGPLLVYVVQNVKLVGGRGPNMCLLLVTLLTCSSGPCKSMGLGAFAVAIFCFNERGPGIVGQQGGHLHPR